MADLREQRLSLGASLRTVGRLVGISHAAVFFAERGELSPALKQRIFEALEQLETEQLRKAAESKRVEFLAVVGARVLQARRAQC